MTTLQNIVYKTEKGTVVTDSVKLAEYLNRRHSNITKAIRRIMEKSSIVMFYETQYKQNGIHPMFIMNRRGFIEVTRTIHGIELQVSAILARFDAVGKGVMEQMPPVVEEAPEKPLVLIGQPVEEAPEKPETSEEETMAYIIGRLDAISKNQDAINVKLDAILDIISGNKPQERPATTIKITNELVSIGEFAKILCQYGITTGEVRLFQWLRDHQFLCAAGSDYNLPRQKYIEQGLFVIKASRVQLPTGQIVEKNTTKVTAKGQEYFINRFLYNQQNGK